MCNFFSLLSDGKGKIYFFGAKIRKAIIAKKLEYEGTDSHTSIADYYNFKGEAEDKLNKWEYNPLTGELKCDQLNAIDDNKQVLEVCKKLDFKKIVPELIIKRIIHPFKIKPPEKITKKHIGLLQQWDSVRGSVRGSVWGSVRDSVWGSVWDSVYAYVGSFFRLPRKDWKYTAEIKTRGYPFQPAVDMWETGLVPSFDGEVWRLHGGPNGGVLFEITKEKLGAAG